MNRNDSDGGNSSAMQMIPIQIRTTVRCNKSVDSCVKKVVGEDIVGSVDESCCCCCINTRNVA